MGENYIWSILYVESNPKIRCIPLHILYFNIETECSTTKSRMTERFANKPSCFVPLFK